jgi:hypothetical protein
MFIIIYKYLIPKNYSAIALFPFIVIKDGFDKKNSVLINHEKIHLRQQVELLILPFYLLYILDYFIKIIRYKDKNKAYRNIVFEREAYAHEKNSTYLDSRSFWGWMKYL